MRIDIFRPCTGTGSGGSQAVTGTTATITPSLSPTPKLPMSILITNSGTDLILIEMNGAAVATTSTPILPNDKQVFDWNPGDGFGVIGVTGSGSTVYWKLGYGA